jgi:hypothetical protein
MLNGAAFVTWLNGRKFIGPALVASLMPGLGLGSLFLTGRCRNGDWMEPLACSNLCWYIFSEDSFARMHIACSSVIKVLWLSGLVVLRFILSTSTQGLLLDLKICDPYDFQSD